MRVLVSGAGVAGLALTRELRRHGVEPLVVEQSTGTRDTGYLVSVRATGVRALEAMGLRDAVAPHAIGFGESRWLDRRHREIKRFPQNDPDKLFVNRGDLHQVLREAAGGTPVRYGTTVTALEQRGDEVAVELSDGTRECFDVVVGADGVHSGVRRLAFGDVGRHRLGAAYFAFAVDRDEAFPPAAASASAAVAAAGGHSSVNQRVLGACAGTGVCTPAGDTVGGYLLYREQEFRPVPPRDRVAELRSRMEAFSPYHRALAAALDPARPVLHDELLQIRLPSWHCGRVVLMGDAAHCLTLLSGMGVSVALAEARVLAAALAEHRTAPGPALPLLHDRFAGHVAKTQRMARTMRRLLLDRHRTSQELADRIVRALPARTSAGRLGRQTHTVLSLDGPKE